MDRREYRKSLGLPEAVTADEELTTLRAENKRLSALVTSQGIRLMAADDDAARVAEYLKTIANLDRLVDSQEADIKKLEARVNGLEGRIGELNAELHERDKTLVDLRLQVARKGGSVAELEARIADAPERAVVMKHDDAVSDALDAYAAALKRWGTHDHDPRRVLTTEDALLRTVARAALAGREDR